MLPLGTSKNAPLGLWLANVRFGQPVERREADAVEKVQEARLSLKQRIHLRIELHVQGGKGAGGSLEFATVDRFAGNPGIHRGKGAGGSLEFDTVTNRPSRQGREAVEKVREARQRLIQ